MPGHIFQLVLNHHNRGGSAPSKCRSILRHQLDLLSNFSGIRKHVRQGQIKRSCKSNGSIKINYAGAGLTT